MIHNKKLVVDDNEINKIVATEFIGYTGAAVTAISSGKECLEYIHKEKYDFILLDHIMPEMDGIQTLEEIRKIRDDKSISLNAIVIVLTANAIQGAKEEYINKGFDDFFSKIIELNLKYSRQGRDCG